VILLLVAKDASDVLLGRRRWRRRWRRLMLLGEAHQRYHRDEHHDAAHTGADGEHLIPGQTPLGRRGHATTLAGAARHRKITYLRRQLFTLTSLLTIESNRSEVSPLR